MVVITSANAPHYIAFDAGEASEWRWTRDYATAYRFVDKTEAERFAACYLPDMWASQTVWFLCQ